MLNFGVFHIFGHLRQFSVSFLAFFSRSFTIAGLYIAIPLVNVNLKDTGYSFYRSGVSLENYSPFSKFELH